MKTCLTITTLLALVTLAACSSSEPARSTSGDFELRSATPGVVDHNVIPKKK